MNFLPRLAARIIGTPLMVEHARMEAILSVIGGRIGIETTALTPEIMPHAGSDRLMVTPNGIAIVPIHGTLAKRVGAVEAVSGLTGYSIIEEMILDAATDPKVKAILLDIDSPGGEVGGVFELAAMIREAGASKPVWSVTNDAFSAAYLLASASGRIYVPQTAGVGSIGVIAAHVDESQRDAQEGRHYTTIFAGTHKNDFSKHEPLSSEARNRLQAEVDRLYGMFISTVANNRNITEEAVRATEAGLYFGGNAVVAGLADRVGTIREALAELSALISPNKSTFAKGTFMQTDLPMVEGSAVDPEVIRNEMRQQLQKEAQAIAEMCLLASLPHLAGGFIAQGMDVDQVRAELLARRASGLEIHSHVMPGDGTRITAESDLATNPVVAACRKLTKEV